MGSKRGRVVFSRFLRCRGLRRQAGMLHRSAKRGAEALSESHALPCPHSEALHSRGRPAAPGSTPQSTLHTAGVFVARGVHRRSVRSASLKAPALKQIREIAPSGDLCCKNLCQLENRGRERLLFSDHLRKRRPFDHAASDSEHRIGLAGQ